MDKAEILKKVNAVFIDVLDNDTIILTNETCANDIEDWDSLNHIQLIVALEKLFGIRFSRQEILNWDNIGKMINSISVKLIELV
jgi:acyl carrier protein